MIVKNPQALPMVTTISAHTAGDFRIRRQGVAGRIECLFSKMRDEHLLLG